MSQIPIHVCPEDTNYRYTGKCQIRSCQFCTDALITGCLRKTASQSTQYSNSELFHYKRSYLDRIGVNRKNFDAYRRRLEHRVKACIVMAMYITWIKDNIKPIEFIDDFEEYEHIRQVMAQQPLKLRALGFEPWMLPMLFSKSKFNRFKEKTTTQDLQLNLPVALKLNVSRMRKLRQEINHALQVAKRKD